MNLVVEIPNGIKHLVYALECFRLSSSMKFKAFVIATFLGSSLAHPIVTSGGDGRHEVHVLSSETLCATDLLTA